jgi:hypothetical protein
MPISNAFRRPSHTLCSSGPEEYAHSFHDGIPTQGLTAPLIGASNDICIRYHSGRMRCPCRRLERRCDCARSAVYF